MDKWELFSWGGPALVLAFTSNTAHIVSNLSPTESGPWLTGPAWAALELPLISTHPQQTNLSPSVPAGHVYDCMPDSHCFFTFRLFFPLNLIIKDASRKLSSKPFKFFYLCILNHLSCV